MATSRSPLLPSWLGICVLLTTLLTLCAPTQAATNSSAIRYVQYTDANGDTVWLDDKRKPALYTQDFGDCHGDSLINVTRFDAAYYKDNMTVLFHLAGSSALVNESLMRESSSGPDT